MRLLAIDFETANPYRDSACAVGLVAVEDGRIRAERAFLIRPPSRWFTFTELHGITWEKVAQAPSFAELWPTLRPWLEGADRLLAHNAPFDASVLRACCARHGLVPPERPFVCTLRLARRAWSLPRLGLAHLCARFGIPLEHHDALSDARACARIALLALAEGHPLDDAPPASAAPATGVADPGPLSATAPRPAP